MNKVQNVDHFQPWYYDIFTPAWADLCFYVMYTEHKWCISRIANKRKNKSEFPRTECKAEYVPAKGCEAEMWQCWCHDPKFQLRRPSGLVYGVSAHNWICSWPLVYISVAVLHAMWTLQTRTVLLLFLNLPCATLSFYCISSTFRAFAGNFEDRHWEYCWAALGTCPGVRAAVAPLLSSLTCRQLTSQLGHII